MYRRFGARVTIIERGSRLAAHEDEDISAALAAMLAAEGVVVRTAADCVALESDDKGIAVTVDCLPGDGVVSGTHVLITVRQRPNTEELGWGAAGWEVDSTTGSATCRESEKQYM